MLPEDLHQKLGPILEFLSTKAWNTDEALWFL